MCEDIVSVCCVYVWVLCEIVGVSLFHMHVFVRVIMNAYMYMGTCMRGREYACVSKYICFIQSGIQSLDKTKHCTLNHDLWQHHPVYNNGKKNAQPLSGPVRNELCPKTKTLGRGAVRRA
jgi:hypothetical protein